MCNCLKYNKRLFEICIPLGTQEEAINVSFIMTDHPFVAPYFKTCMVINNGQSSRMIYIKIKQLLGYIGYGIIL